MSIPIDGEHFCLAMENSDPPMACYLDLETGEVLLASDPNYTGDYETIGRVESCPDQYLKIDPVGSSQAFRIMETFVESLPEGNMQDDLCRALSGRKPFRTFKDRLCDYPDSRGAWFRFKEDEMCQLAIEWLRENEVDAVLVRRERSQPK